METEARLRLSCCTTTPIILTTYAKEYKLSVSKSSRLSCKKINVIWNNICCRTFRKVYPTFKRTCIVNANTMNVTQVKLCYIFMAEISNTIADEQSSVISFNDSFTSNRKSWKIIITCLFNLKQHNAQLYLKLY